MVIPNHWFLLYNRNRFLTLLFICLMMLARKTNAQNESLVISEFMASNSQTLMDEDGDYSDWIEIYNPSSEEVNVDGWYISDNSENLIKWIFPNKVIPSYGFLVVFASGKDKRTGEFHTNFRLSRSGESLFLTKPDGKTMASFIDRYPPQETDISYSLIDTVWSFAQATPGQTNSIGDYLNPPAFSVSHGFFTQPFSLTISNITDDNIIYTLDGSKPEAQNGLTYKDPLMIDSTTTIRAAAIAGDQLSNTTTSTYIFPEAVLKQPANPIGYPASWGSFSRIDGLAPADYEMDPDLTNHPDYKDLLTDALLSIPSLSIVTSIGNLFSHTVDPISGGIYIYNDPPTGGLGENWERPVSVEYLDPKGNTGFRVNCGIRIHGGHSRVKEKCPKQSFRLVFRDEFGGPSVLKYKIFYDLNNDEFNSIVLSARFNHSWLHWDTNQRNVAQYIRDSWAKDTWKKMGHTAASNKFVHLYINGLYWGLYNISERMDDDFMVDHLGGEKDDWDVIKDYAEVAEGNKDAWNTMMDMSTEGLSDAESYYRIQGKNAHGELDESLEAFLDVENLIDYMLLNFYAGNLDWDHHNWAAARNRVNPGKGFQFFPWDSERIFYKTTNNVVDELNEDKPSFLYSQLRKNPLFRIQFAQRANELLGAGGLLSPDSVKVVWMKRSKEVELAVIAESARWGDYRRDMHQHKDGPYDLYTKKDHWDVEQERLLNDYFPRRSQIVLDQLKEIGLAGEVITGTGQDVPTSADAVKAYPMPFSNLVTIDYYASSAGSAELLIFSGNGQVKYSSQINQKTAGKKQFNWKPVNERGGIYFYLIRTDDFTYSGKLIYIH
jgi:hypothetical protein